MININILQETRNNKNIYYIEDDNGVRTDLYIIDKKNETIEYFINNFVTNSILLDGFTSLPDFVKPIGRNFKTAGLRYYLNKYFQQEKISSLVVSSKQKSSCSGNKIILNVEDFKKLRKIMIYARKKSRKELQQTILSVLSNLFPQYFHLVENISIKTDKNSLLTAIDTININDLTEKDINKITDFAFSLASKFKKSDINKRILVGINDKIRIKTLEEILDEYKKLLEEEPTEAKWQTFFNKYIRIFDTRYIDNISQVNISVFGIKKPDIMMLDLHNYIDIYELKTTKTNLLNYDNSHDNYYWHPDIAKVISQTEKYIKIMNDNSSEIIRTIKTQLDKNVEIIYPKAIVIAGHSKQLQNEKQKQDFKMLRECLKNISFVLYDEFYYRLNNFYELLKKSESDQK